MEAFGQSGKGGTDKHENNPGSGETEVEEAFFRVTKVPIMSTDEAEKNSEYASSGR